MAWKIGLGALQALGALSLLPYPAVLTANVMQMAAEGPRGLGRFIAALPYALLCLYPLAWLGLFAWSWRLLNRGAPGAAMLVSVIPAVASAIGARFILTAEPPSDAQISQSRQEQAAIEQVNPLVWTLLSTSEQRPIGAPNLAPGIALKAVAESDRVNVPVAKYGTPLQVALRNLTYNFDGTPYDKNQTALAQIVRALQARGATLSPEENQKWDNLWRLRRANFDGPVTTRSENPLVYRILSTNDPSGPYYRDSIAFEMRPAELPWINKPTRLHGTPLYTALRLKRKDATAQLLQAGAHLTPEESAEPVAAAALAAFLAGNPGSR